MDESTEPADEAVLQDIADGDVEALAVLYDRYARAAYSVAVRVLGDSNSAEDVVQEAFLNVWRRAGTYTRERGSARTWVLSIIHHRTIDALRARRRRVSADAPVEEGRDVSGPPDEVWEGVARDFDRDAVREAMAVIPADQRAAIEMAFFQGMTHREIAEHTGIPVGTVKGRIRIGMEKMRARLDGANGAGI